MLAAIIALKYQGTGRRSCSARIVPQRGHSPSAPRSSSSTRASHSSHQTYLRYIESGLREKFDLGATPLKLRVRVGGK